MANVEPERRVLTAPMVAARLGVSPDKVRRWIRSGELVAMNLAAHGGGRPRFGIELDALADFQRRRQTAHQRQSDRRGSGNRGMSPKSFFRDHRLSADFQRSRLSVPPH